MQPFNLLMSGGYSGSWVAGPEIKPKIWYPIDHPHILVIDLLHDTEKVSICTPFCIWLSWSICSWALFIFSLFFIAGLVDYGFGTRAVIFYATLMMGFIGLVIIGWLMEFYENEEIQPKKRKETQGDYLFFLHLHGVDPEIATISDFFKHEKVKKRLITRGISIPWKSLVLHSDASDSSDSDST